MSKRELAMLLAWECLWLPYRWGGDDPIKGFDCSGFVIEMLKSAGVLQEKGDWTAAQLWEIFEDRSSAGPHRGCLVFWWDGVHVRHVELCLDQYFSIGASGGGRRVRTEQDAELCNAHIKVRPLGPKGQLGIKGYLDPFLGA